MSRAEVTERLSRLIEKRLTSRHMYWAAEVSFDKGTERERRIDYVAFKPFTPNLTGEPTSVELGTFECYEVKSCMADFASGHGLTFYGDRNYLVTTPELEHELVLEHLIPVRVDATLVPNKPGTALLEHSSYPLAYEHHFGSQSYRRRIASEMLWQMVQADIHHDDATTGRR